MKVFSEPLLDIVAPASTQILEEQPAVLSKESAAALHRARECPDSPGVWLTLGNALSGQGLWRKALLAYSASAAREPFCGEAHLLRGIAHLRLEQFQESTASFILADRILTDNIQCRFLLGQSLYLTGDYPRAQAAFQSCFLTHDPTGMDAQAYDWACLALMRLGRLDEAKQIAGRAAQPKMAGHGPAYDHLLLYSGKMSCEEALSHFSSSLAETAYGPACYLIYTGDPDRGYALLKECADCDDWTCHSSAARRDLREWGSGSTSEGREYHD